MGSLQECPVNARVPQGFILGLTLYLWYINDLSADDFIFNIAIYADGTTLYMWPDIRSVATTKIGSWTWIWSKGDCGLGQEVACWFQCKENSTGFI